MSKRDGLASPRPRYHCNLPIGDADIFEQLLLHGADPGANEAEER